MHFAKQIIENPGKFSRIFLQDLMTFQPFSGGHNHRHG